MKIEGQKFVIKGEVVYYGEETDYVSKKPTGKTKIVIKPLEFDREEFVKLLGINTEDRFCPKWCYEDSDTLTFKTKFEPKLIGFIEGEGTLPWRGDKVQILGKVSNGNIYLNKIKLDEKGTNPSDELMFD